MQSLLGDYHGFVDEINRGLEAAGIERQELALFDHLGYAPETLDEYYSAREAFRSLGEDMGETEIAGRPISVYEFYKPLESGGWVIPFLELAAPKEGSDKPHGLDHAEFVTVRRLGTFARMHSELKMVPGGRSANPDFRYRIGSITVKFHRVSLGTLVESETEEVTG